MGHDRRGRETVVEGHSPSALRGRLDSHMADEFAWVVSEIEDMAIRSHG